MTAPWVAAREEGIFIHQIYYNDETHALLDPHFIPLDNTANLRPDCYEFWVILEFLRSNALRDDAWYGFLSPRFGAKSGFRGGTLHAALRRYRNEADVVLPTYGPGQLAYFLNVFEQGEFWHPGMLEPSRTFFARHGVPIGRLVSHSRNCNYSNYVIARAPFWRRWREIAEDLWAVAEAPDSPLRDLMSTYGPKIVPTKVFIQERIGPVILATQRLRTLQLRAPLRQDVDTMLFHNTPEQFDILNQLDAIKQRYTATGDPSLLRAFFKLRGGEAVPARPKAPPP